MPIKSIQPQTDRILADLADIRQRGEQARAELYWTVLRSRKWRNHSAAVSAFLNRRRSLRLLTNVA